MTGPLIIVSGPSGSGKSTVIRLLLARGDLPLHLSVSATTRERRPGEVDGKDYYFWGREEFEKHLAANELVEWAEVHGNCYGTLKNEIEGPRAKGVGVILDIDVQGAQQVRKQYTECVSIFLCTSSFEVYRERLERRHTEAPATIARRLETAKKELEHREEYDYIVLNDDLETAVAGVHDLIAMSFEKGGPHAG
jgi:guanylate kinase